MLSLAYHPLQEFVAVSFEEENDRSEEFVQFAMQTLLVLERNRKKLAPSALHDELRNHLKDRGQRLNILLEC